MKKVQYKKKILDKRKNAREEIETVGIKESKIRKEKRKERKLNYVSLLFIKNVV